MASVQTKMQAEIIYRTEYILRSAQLMKAEDLATVRNGFLQSLKDGVAIIQAPITVEAHQQPVAILLSDGTIVKLEGSND